MRGLPFALPLALLCSAARAQLPADLGTPPSARAQAVLDAIPDENTPSPPRHYPVSNEFRLDLWGGPLHDLGGAIVGVGTDQNYTMAAMSGAQLVFCVDYDPTVPFMHAIYSVLVPASATRQELVAHFDPPNEEATASLLAQGLAGRPNADQIVRYYREHRLWVGRYLHRVARARSPAGGPVAWVGDDGWYATVRSLFHGRRIVARNGDVTGARTMRAVADAARQLGVVVRAVYVSNADQFFDYTPQFVANARALPTDGRSLFLRTARHPLLPVAGPRDWHYIVEDMPDFLARLETGHYPRSFQIIADLVARRQDIGRDGVSHIGAATPRLFLDRAVPPPVAHQRQHHGPGSSGTPRSATP